MECNEVTLYDIKDNSLIKKIINDEDIECKYTIPLIFLLFNELFGKTKFKFDNNYLMFPSHYFKLWTSKNLNELRYIIKKKILYNKFKCKKNMDYFLDGKKDKYIIYATNENDEEYFSEQFYEIIYYIFIINNYYFKL